MDNCLACHIGSYLVRVMRTGARAGLLVVLFQHDSTPWVGLLETERHQLLQSDESTPKLEIRYLSANAAMGGSKGWRAASAP